MKYIKKFELVDYNEFDLSEVDEYEGNLYLYSEHKVNLKDIKSDELIVYPHNRADASGTDSEYIYQIKVKKPLRKRIMDFMFFEEDEEEIDESKYSGIFYEGNITREWKASIKKEDIISFRYIGGFVKYDKFTPKNPNLKLSEKTNSWLYSYISGSLLLKKLTDDIIEELKPLRPKKPIKIYKGIEEVQINYYSMDKRPYKLGQTVESYFNLSTSWTTNILIARRFVDDYPSSQPFVAQMTVNPIDILVDVQMLPEQHYHTNQREIIDLPGNYEYKLIWMT